MLVIMAATGVRNSWAASAMNCFPSRQPDSIRARIWSHI
jgi:hypothetical protein